MRDKRFELMDAEIDAINEVIGEHFACSNSDYSTIQNEIEEKWGEGSLMLAFRQTKAKLIRVK